MNIFKSKGGIIKHNGVMADLSTKISIFLNELTSDQVIELNELVKQRELDIILMKSGDLEKLEDFLTSLQNFETDHFEFEEE